jgi:heterodisulfide reductase subunit B
MTEPKPKLRYAFFLGCNIPLRAQNYEISARKIAEAFDIDLVDVAEFGCCGYPLADANKNETLLLSARNLALAEKVGCDVCTLCSACAGALTEAAHQLRHNEELRGAINAKLADEGLACSGKTEVTHFARILYEEVGLHAIKEKVTLPLDGIRIAPHYGCHYMKPSEIYGFDDVENPTTLDELIAATGAQPVDYNGKLRCCGGGILAVDEEAALKVTKAKLDSIAKIEADAIGLVCPFCGIMYDTNQKTIESKYETEYGIPVLFYPQILGLAMGMDSKELGMRINRVKPKEMLSKIEALAQKEVAT